MILPVKKGNNAIANLLLNESSVLSWKLMGEKEIRVSYTSREILPLTIGDYVTIGGENFTINTIPNYQKVSNYEHKYEIVFESDLYRLYDKKFKDEGRGDFSYFGTPETFTQLLVDNINEIDAGWAVGFVDDLEGKNLTFENISCREALNKIAEAFSLEWYLTGKTINLVKQAGSLTTLEFEYGKGKGLYSLAYSYQSDKNIVTRAWGYGSSRNLPAGYRDGANRLMFEEQYLENNVDLYRVKEGDFVTEDIYPHRDGALTAVGTITEGQPFTVTDSTLDFNINDYLLEGSEAKVVFKSGELSGYEFVITSYNNTTKVITCKPLTEQSGYTMPNASRIPAIGDTYALVDISMPQSYIDAAELELREKTQEYLNENSVPRVLYSLEMDPVFARSNNIVLKPGDRVRVKDAQLGLDEIIRVSSVSYPLNFPEVLTPQTKISAEIANFVPYTVTERVVASTIDNKKAIKVVDRTNAEKARVNAMNLRQLQGLIFNPDGSLFEGFESLLAGSLFVGFGSQNFSLVDVTINPNAGGDENSMIISSGKLVHYEYSIDGLGFEWLVETNNWTDLDPAKYYYVYAKCSKTALTGTWEISETPVHVDDIVGYHVFNLGVLYQVNADGYRDFEFTKGMTYIVGDNITTGRIKDLSSQNYFDLDASQFNMGDAESGIDWNVTTPSVLTIRGAVATKEIRVGSGGNINAGISGIDETGATSIRFYAGSDFENRATAKFRVQDDGKVYMEDASVKGHIEATSGKIGGFTIEDGSLVNTSTEAEGIILTNSDGTLSVKMGAASDSDIGGLAVAEFKNTRNSGTLGQNRAVYIACKNGGNNVALTLESSGGDSNTALYIPLGKVILNEVKDRVTSSIYSGTVRVHVNAQGIRFLTLD